MAGIWAYKHGQSHDAKLWAAMFRLQLLIEANAPSTNNVVVESFLSCPVEHLRRYPSGPSTTFPAAKALRISQQLLLCKLSESPVASPTTTVSPFIPRFAVPPAPSKLLLRSGSVRSLSRLRNARQTVPRKILFRRPLRSLDVCFHQLRIRQYYVSLKCNVAAQ